MTTPTEDSLPSCGGSHCILISVIVFFARVRLKLFLRYAKPILRRIKPSKTTNSACVW